MNTRNFFKTLIGAAGGAIVAKLLPAVKATPAAVKATPAAVKATPAAAKPFVVPYDMTGWPTPNKGLVYIRSQVTIRQVLTLNS